MTAPTMTDRRPATGLVWVLRILGAALLAAMGWIHLDLWLDGYRSIDVIGPAFLLNAVAGFGFAALLLLAPRALLPWVAALGGLTALGTLAGLLLATTVGLFGFVETTAATLWWESFWAEVAAVVVLAGLTLAARPRRPDART
jgi:hypothetical protein